MIVVKVIYRSAGMGDGGVKRGEEGIVGMIVSRNSPNG